MAGFERYLKSKIVRFGERLGEPRRERLRPSRRFRLFEFDGW